MKKLFLLFLPFFLFSCNSEDVPQKPEKEQAEVTVWGYFVADTNIKSDIRNNIKTMYEGLSKMDKQATLLIYWDGGSSDSYLESSPSIIRYTPDGYGNINGLAARDSSYSIRFICEQAETVKAYPSQLSTDKDVMTSALKDMKSFSPTEKIVFVAGSHGSAWWKNITSSAKSTRAFGQDGSNTENTITTPDMAEAIANAGVKLDLLLFDACMMGTTEVSYDFRNVTNYMLVSALDVPAPGFPYFNIMNSLYEGTTNHYTQVAQSYINYYATYPGGWGSIALVDCKEMNNLTTAIKEQIIAHKDDLYSYDPIGKLQHYGLNPYVSSFKFISFDTKQFMEDINGGTIPSNFANQLNKTILYADCIEHTSDYTIEKSKFCGLGMYIPVKVRTFWNEYFKTLDWYTAAGWNEISFNWE